MAFSSRKRHLRGSKKDHSKSENAVVLGIASPSPSHTYFFALFWLKSGVSRRSEKSSVDFEMLFTLGRRRDQTVITAGMKIDWQAVDWEDLYNATYRATNTLKALRRLNSVGL